MFAVVEISGHQYKVEPNNKVRVDKLDAEPGKSIQLNSVLMYSPAEGEVKIGQPYVDGAMVEAKVLDHVKGDKIRVFKFTSKKRHQKTQGHRQEYTLLEITEIKG